jgi:aspartate beta-hydroxylase
MGDAPTYVLRQATPFRCTPSGDFQAQTGTHESTVIPRDLVTLLLRFSTPQTIDSVTSAAADECQLEPEDARRVVETWIAAGVLGEPGSPADRQPSRLGLFQTALAEREHGTTSSSSLCSHFELQRPRLFYPGLATAEFHDPRRFPWVAALEDSFPAIRRELLDLLAAMPLAVVHGSYTTTGEWTAAYFWQFGKKVEDNTRRCPRTATALRQVPGAMAFGVSLFSALAPGTFLAPHYGITNAKLRCQLPLVVPAGCRLKVGDIEVEQEEGKCIVFDDSFLHSAWNPSERDRYVLVLDFFHPDLTAVEVAYLSTLAS